MTVQPRVQKGVPTGGQFSSAQHPESGLSLEAPVGMEPLQRIGLEQRLTALKAAAKEERLLRDALWADSVRKAAPEAAGAYIRRTGRGISHLVDRVVPFDADGNELPIDPDEARRLADVDVVADDLEPARKVKLERFDRAYADHAATTSVVVAAFDKANPEHHRKLAIAASQIEATAIEGHVDAIRQRVLDQDPEAIAVVVHRDEDAVYGCSYRLAHAVRADGSESPASLDGLDEYLLQGTAFDDHVDAFLEYDDFESETLNIPLRNEGEA